MIQNVAQRLKLLAIFALAFALPAFGSDQSPTQPTAPVAPIAKIYEGETLIGEIIKVGPVLGSGHFGSVQKVLIRYSSGETQTIALKTLDSTDNTARMQYIAKAWTLLKPVFSQDHEKVLNKGTAGLKLVPINEKDQTHATSVIMSTIADGSISSQQESLVLNPKEARYEAKIAVLAKLHQQMLSGITLMTSHGLTHGDIKPDNILYTKKPGFDWEHPDPEKIRFSLTDFDSITPLGQSIRYFTKASVPPEIFSKFSLPPKLLALVNFSATPAWDIFSESVSTYSMIFGSKPLEDYLTSLREKGNFLSGIDSERLKFYSDPKLYAEILHHVDSRFKNLESQTVSPVARKTLQELHSSILSGLAYSAEDRMMSFPKIRNAARNFLNSAELGEKARCEALLPYLKAHLH